MLTIRYAVRASQGARSYQEDAAAVWPGVGAEPDMPPSPLAPRGVPPDGIVLAAVLADGMGGHAAGDVASNTICGIFLQRLGAEPAPVPDSMQARLARSLDAANAAIGATVEANPGLRGMGATCVGLVAHAANLDTTGLDTIGLDWISVGDSPLYIFRRGTLLRLNADHSLAPELDRLVAEGRMSAAQALADPRRHQLRAAVTGDDLDLIDAPDELLQLEAGDAIVLASDGLLTLDDEDIRRLIGAYRDDGAGAIADALIRAVDAAGAVHQDNTTVVVLVVA